jgi:hypothetical protein
MLGAEAYASSAYQLRFRVYGRDGVMGPLEPLNGTVPHEIAVTMEITARTQELATSIAKSVSHLALHHPVPEWTGAITALAFPYTPPELERGPVYRWSFNHVVEPNDPCEMFRLVREEV